MRAPRTAAAFFLALCAPIAQAGSLRFLGTPSTSADRVEIRLDAPARPVDVGGDFTIEFFLRVAPGSNPVAQPCTAANDRWIFGNILLDRDVFGAGDAGDWGVSLMQGRIAFGASVGSVGATACGATDLRDGDWHHVALTRSASSGQLRVFVDGQVDGQASAAAGDMSYRDGRTTQWPQSDPFLVLGNEKHFGPEAFAGWLDELRISRGIRHGAAYVPPSAPFTSDADTMALYSFDEGTGTSLGDRSGAPGGPSNGVLRVGADPAGPLWSSETPFAAVLPATASSRLRGAEPDRRARASPAIERAVEIPAAVASRPAPIALPGPRPGYSGESPRVARDRCILPRNQPMPRRSHRLRRAFAILALSASGLAAACPSDLPTTLSLTLLPGEIRGVEHVLQVNVQEDGCLRVHRPAHWRNAGRFGGALADTSLRGAQAMAQIGLLAGFDGGKVAAELAAADEARGEAFAVEGADRYVLRWTDTGGRRHEVAFAGIFQYAERHPERDDLAAFAALVSMLQAQAARDDLVDLEAAP